MSRNVFRDLGLPDPEARMIKAELIDVLGRHIEAKSLTCLQVAEICGIDEATLSIILGGRSRLVTIDQLQKWLIRLDGEIARESK